jgi:hypothetical protein
LFKAKPVTDRDSDGRLMVAPYVAVIASQQGVISPTLVRTWLSVSFIVVTQDLAHDLPSIALCVGQKRCFHLKELCLPDRKSCSPTIHNRSGTSAWSEAIS